MFRLARGSRPAHICGGRDLLLAHPTRSRSRLLQAQHGTKLFLMNVHGVDAAIASSLGGGGVSIARGPRVLFLVHHTRKTMKLMRAVNDTWCHGLRACVFFSDQRAKSGEAGSSAFITAPEALERLLNSYQIAQLRYLPALHAVRRRMLRDGGRRSYPRAGRLPINSVLTFAARHPRNGPHSRVCASGKHDHSLPAFASRPAERPRRAGSGQ